MKKIIVAVIMLALLLMNVPKPLEKVVAQEGAEVTFHLDKAAEGAEFKGNTYRVVCGAAEAARLRSLETPLSAFVKEAEKGEFPVAVFETKPLDGKNLIFVTSGGKI